MCPRCRKYEVYRKSWEYTYRVGEGEGAKTYTAKDVPIPTCNYCGERIFDYVADEAIRSQERAKGG